MTEIRQRTGLSRDKANHRFTRLERLGLIEVSYATEGYGDREPPKVAHLTGLARREIERGLFAPLQDLASSPETAVDVLAELNSIQEVVDRHQSQLDALTASTNEAADLEERVETIHNDLSLLEKYVSQWDEEAEEYLIALKLIVEEEGVDFGEYRAKARRIISKAIGDP